MAATLFQFTTLENIYYYYNYKLFDGQLPECIITLARHRGAHGVFAPERWLNVEKKPVNEIVLNPETMNRPTKAWHSTLVHEACHHWQKIFGKYCGAYHDRQWAAKMEEVGLMPSSTGEPGGKRTGYRVTHYVIEGGPFDRAFNEISAEQLDSLGLPYQPNALYAAKLVLPGGEEEEEQDQGSGRRATTKPATPRKSRNGVKAAYICACTNKVWGKSGLSINCASCGQPYTEQ